MDRERILELLVKAEIFEQTIQSRYLGTKRFSLEGESALLPLLDAILNARLGVRGGKGHAGDEPSRPAERDGEHRGAARRRSVCPL